MKKLVSVLLVLVLALAAVSAFADVPANVKEIEGLPERPTDVPSMKVKSSGVATTVTLTGPVTWMAAVRNWGDYTSLEFDAANSATYSTAGQKLQPGFGVWGWANAESLYYSADLGTDDPRSWWKAYEYFEKPAKTYDYGEHYHEYTKLVKKSDCHWYEEMYGMWINGGNYGMPYAYHGEANGVTIYYDQYGRLCREAVTLTDKNFFGAETAPAKTTVTWSRGLSCEGIPVWYIMSIEAENADGSKLTAEFAQNGKLLRVK